MQVLVHIGLNKCASTYIQKALDRSRPQLAEAGVYYPAQDGPPCQYGLSKFYGFGPISDEIREVSITRIVREAKRRGHSKIILSSEYFSLNRPTAAKRMADDLRQNGCSVQVLMYSRDIPGWVRSLFNQYIRTVEGGRYLPNIDSYVDQILTNGACDIAGRYRMWAQIIGASAIHHFRIRRQDPLSAVLHPFAGFVRSEITATGIDADNQSIDADALYHIGKLRQCPRSPERDSAIADLLSGGQTDMRAPPDYMRLSQEKLSVLEERVIAPYRMLPVSDLNGGPQGPSDIGQRPAILSHASSDPDQASHRRNGAAPLPSAA